jgi:hypothetical protein
MRITKDQVVGALKLMGLEFQDSEIDMMLRGVNQAISNYETLRKADVPIDTEPAFAFHPGLPDRQPVKGPQRFDTTIPKAPAMKAPSNLEDLAFWRIVDLAPLLKSRAVSSTDLTKMYLARMQKYSPKLLCLITATEELALQQAAAADQEIRAGHYRGPLHGIPFGLKDLFDTKGILTTFGAEPYQTRVADKDATAGERLRPGGAVLTAKLLLGALAQGGLWFKGMTKTPWAHQQTSNGRAPARLPPPPRAGGLHAGNRDAGFDHFTEPGMRNRGTAATYVHQPVRRDGAELTMTKWADLPRRGRLRDRPQRSMAGRARDRTMGATLPLRPPQAALEPAHRNSPKGLRPRAGRAEEGLGYGDRRSHQSWREDDAHRVCRRRSHHSLPAECRSRRGLRRHHPRRPGAQSARPECRRLAE